MINKYPYYFLYLWHYSPVYVFHHPNGYYLKVYYDDLDIIHRTGGQDVSRVIHIEVLLINIFVNIQHIGHI